MRAPGGACVEGKVKEEERAISLYVPAVLRTLTLLKEGTVHR